MSTAGLSVADAQAIAHLFDVLPFVVIGGIALVFFLLAKSNQKSRQDSFSDEGQYVRRSDGRIVWEE